MKSLNMLQLFQWQTFSKIKEDYFFINFTNTYNNNLYNKIYIKNKHIYWNIWKNLDYWIEKNINFMTQSCNWGGPKKKLFIYLILLKY